MHHSEQHSCSLVMTASPDFSLTRPMNFARIPPAWRLPDGVDAPLWQYHAYAAAGRRRRRLLRRPSALSG